MSFELEFETIEEADRYFELYKSFIPWKKVIEYQEDDFIIKINSIFCRKMDRIFTYYNDYSEWKYVTLDFLEKYNDQLDMHSIYMDRLLDLPTAIKYQKQIELNDRCGGGWGASKLSDILDPMNTWINPQKLK